MICSRIQKLPQVSCRTCVFQYFLKISLIFTHKRKKYLVLRFENIYKYFFFFKMKCFLSFNIRRWKKFITINYFLLFAFLSMCKIMVGSFDFTKSFFFLFRHEEFATLSKSLRDESGGSSFFITITCVLLQPCRL